MLHTRGLRKNIGLGRKSYKYKHYITFAKCKFKAQRWREKGLKGWKVFMFVVLWKSLSEWKHSALLKAVQYEMSNAVLFAQFRWTGAWPQTTATWDSGKLNRLSLHSIAAIAARKSRWSSRSWNRERRSQKLGQVKSKALSPEPKMHHSKGPHSSSWSIHGFARKLRLKHWTTIGGILQKVLWLYWPALCFRVWRGNSEGLPATCNWNSWQW